MYCTVESLSSCVCDVCKETRLEFCEELHHNQSILNFEIKVLAQFWYRHVLKRLCQNLKNHHMRSSFNTISDIFDAMCWDLNIEHSQAYISAEVSKSHVVAQRLTKPVGKRYFGKTSAADRSRLGLWHSIDHWSLTSCQCPAHSDSILLQLKWQADYRERLHRIVILHDLIQEQKT